jgi:preprotein translocase subunit SecE
MYNRNDVHCADKEVAVTTAAKKKKKENRLVRYFKQTRAELRKVTWPARDEAIRLTAIVLAVTVAMAAFLGLLDYLLTLGFGLFI